MAAGGIRRVFQVDTFTEINHGSATQAWGCRELFIALPESLYASWPPAPVVSVACPLPWHVQRPPPSPAERP